MVKVSIYKTMEAVRGEEVKFFSFFKLDATWGG